MGFSSKHKLHWPGLIRKDCKQTVGIAQQQVRALIRGEAPGEPQSESIGFENPTSFFDFLRSRAMPCDLATEMGANELGE